MNTNLYKASFKKSSILFCILLTACGSEAEILVEEDVLIEEEPATALIANDDTISLTQGTTFTSEVNLISNDTSVNDDPLTVFSGSFGTTENGSIVIESDGSYTYTPPNDFIGTDSFIYTLRNGELTDTATLTLIVISPPLATNSAPIAVSESISLPFNSTFTSSTSLLSNDSDENGDTLSIAEGTYTTEYNGSLTVDAEGNYTYTPAAGFTGTDSFSYFVSDGFLGSSATLTISVIGIAENSSPVANNDQIVVIQNTTFTSTVNLIANDSDADGDTLSVVSGTYTTTENGTLELQSNGSYTYTPATGFVGSDSVDYTLSDGDLTDNATLSVIVTPTYSSCDRHISVDGSGNGLDISSPGNMFDLDSFLSALSEGGELCIHSGTYGTNYVIRSGGTESNPVIIRGILTDSRLPLFKGIFQAGPDVMGGEDTFQIAASNLIFQDMEFENVGQAFRLALAAENITMEKFKAVNVEAAVHIESSEHIENITISKAMILQFSRGGIFIGGGDATNINIIDNYIDMQPEKIGGRGVEYAVGISIHKVSDVEIRNTTVLNVIGKFTDYIQGDGIDASPEVDGIFVVNSYFRGHQDGCIDTKAANTVIEDTIAIGCKISFRLWQNNAPNGPYCNRCISYQPVGSSHFGVYENDGSSDVIEVYSDNDALIFLPVNAGTVLFQVNTARGTIPSSAAYHPNLSITDDQLSYGLSFIIPPIPNPTDFTP